jgi:hypothetical protein
MILEFRFWILDWGGQRDVSQSQVAGLLKETNEIIAMTVASDQDVARTKMKIVNLSCVRWRVSPQCPTIQNQEIQNPELQQSGCKCVGKGNTSGGR